MNPIDLQAILLRMDSISKLQQRQQDGITAAQSLKGMELSEIARIESNRVNEVKPHPDGNSKVEDKKEEERSSKEKKKKRGAVGPVEKKGTGSVREDDDFNDPLKGTIIDTKR